MKKIKISFIGAGFFSQISHLINYYRNKNVELFEICELDKKLAYGVKKKFRFTGNVYSDYKKMNLNKTDGFVIVVQRRLLNGIANYFLKKGCSIFTEKPHAYNVVDFKRNRNIQKGIWLKGYVRRSDLAVRYLKENFNIFRKKFGKLNYVNFEAKNGDSYLGAKHYVTPSIKKIFNSSLSKYPKFLLKKNYLEYDTNLNSACHSIDLFDFFKFKDFKIKNVEINSENFLINFLARDKNKNNFLSRIHLSSSKVNNWHEKMEFMFEFGQVILKFNAPLDKKSSHILIIKNSKTKNDKKIYFKNRWSFNEQSKNFVNLLIKNKKSNKENQDSADGLNSINFYEKIWKFKQNFNI